MTLDRLLHFIKAQETYIGDLRVKELVAGQSGDADKIARARAAYDSAVEGLHTMQAEYDAAYDAARRNRRRTEG